MATLDQVVTIPELRRELRLRSAANDDLLTRHRRAAVGYVERLIERAIVTREDVELRAAVPAGAGDILTFRVRDAVAPSGAPAVRYRPADAVRGPDRTATVNAGGVAVDVARVDVWPPADGWPAMHAEAGVSLTINVGVPEADLRPEWGQAAVLVARELYDGNALDALPSSGVVERLLRPYWPTFAD